MLCTYLSELAEILLLYNGRFLALKWTSVSGFALSNDSSRLTTNRIESSDKEE